MAIVNPCPSRAEEGVFAGCRITLSPDLPDKPAKVYLYRVRIEPLPCDRSVNQASVDQKRGALGSNLGSYPSGFYPAAEAAHTLEGKLELHSIFPIEVGVAEIRYEAPGGVGYRMYSSRICQQQLSPKPTMSSTAWSASRVSIAPKTLQLSLMG